MMEVSKYYEFSQKAVKSKEVYESFKPQLKTEWKVNFWFLITDLHGLRVFCDKGSEN